MSAWTRLLAASSLAIGSAWDLITHPNTGSGGLSVVTSVAVTVNDTSMTATVQDAPIAALVTDTRIIASPSPRITAVVHDNPIAV